MNTLPGTCCGIASAAPDNRNPQNTLPSIDTNYPIQLPVPRDVRACDIPGPQPATVARYIPNKARHNWDQVFQDRRARLERLQEAENVTKQENQAQFRQRWEEDTTKKVKQTYVKREIERAKANYEISVDKRRDKLREMLRNEEARHMRDIQDSALQESKQRVAKMRDRVMFLKQKKEDDRLQLVKEKLDQQFRFACDDIRTHMQRQKEQEIYEQRQVQLQIKGERLRQQQEDDRMFAEMWFDDIRKKEEREKQKAYEQSQRKTEMLETLAKQRAALDAKRKEDEILRREEAELMKEYDRLITLEKQQEAETKRREKLKHKRRLDKFMRQRLEQKEREMQEEMAREMEFLQLLITESKNEDEEIRQKKEQLAHEINEYMRHLDAERKRRLASDQEAARMINEDIERQWNKRITQWEKDAEARRLLLCDTLKTRRQQLEQKISDNDRKRAEKEAEVKSMEKALEVQRKVEEEATRNADALSKQYASDLKSQMNYNARQRRLLADEEQRFWDKQKQSEILYKQKVDEFLNRGELPAYVHPFRKALLHSAPISNLSNRVPLPAINNRQKSAPVNSYT